jgi:hypothetical protein
MVDISGYRRYCVDLCFVDCNNAGATGGALESGEFFEE